MYMKIVANTSISLQLCAYEIKKNVFLTETLSWHADMDKRTHFLTWFDSIFANKPVKINWSTTHSHSKHRSFSSSFPNFAGGRRRSGISSWWSQRVERLHRRIAVQGDLVARRRQQWEVLLSRGGAKVVKRWLTTRGAAGRGDACKRHLMEGRCDVAAWRSRHGRAAARGVAAWRGSSSWRFNCAGKRRWS